MTKKQAYTALIKAAREALKHDYVVVIWTPEELEGVDNDEVESRCIAAGNDYISDMKS